MILWKLLTPAIFIFYLTDYRSWEPEKAQRKRNLLDQAAMCSLAEGGFVEEPSAGVSADGKLCQVGPLNQSYF